MWARVLGLLEDPAPELIQAEIDRRLETMHATHPATGRRDALKRDLTRAQTALRRLLDGCQERLITLEKLRARTPELRKRETALQAQLDALDAELHDAETYLKLSETLEGFRARLSANAKSPTVEQRQQIIRLVVREVLIGEDEVTIRHSIPIPAGDQPPVIYCVRVVEKSQIWALGRRHATSAPRPGRPLATSLSTRAAAPSHTWQRGTCITPTCSTGSNPPASADHVVVGIAVDADIDWLAAADSAGRCRVPVGRGGMPVDADGRTEFDDVFVAGDTAATFEPLFGARVPGSHWEAAGRQGARAARDARARSRERAAHELVEPPLRDPHPVPCHARLADSFTIDGDTSTRILHRSLHPRLTASCRTARRSSSFTTAVPKLIETANS